MGYYDQDYENTRQKQKGNRGGWFVSALVGALLGALLLVISIPTLSKWNILPYDVAITGEKDVATEATDTNGAQIGEQKMVSVNVISEVTKAVDKVSDAVVGVINIQQASFWSDGSLSEAGTGSGVIYKKEGERAYIVTNQHVIADSNKIEVSLSDGTRVEAKVLGSDIWTDLAVLEIDGTDVTTIADFGNSDQVRLGEPVLAIGNPLGLQFSGSVTQGIISGTNRTIPIDINQDGTIDWQAEVLQTDAAINPGNSGGALVNIEGEVIGINSMKIAQQAVEGIGLSIPITTAKPVIEDLESIGEVRRPYMGVSLKSLKEIQPSYHLQETLKLPLEIKEGVAILEVVPVSPAAQAGLKQFDVIVELDGEKIKNIIDLRKHLYTKKDIGDSMEVTIYRNGEKQTVTMKLAEESL